MRLREWEWMDDLWAPYSPVPTPLRVVRDSRTLSWQRVAACEQIAVVSRRFDTEKRKLKAADVTLFK